MDETTLLYLVEAVAVGFLIGYFLGFAAARRSQRPDPSDGKTLHMEVRKEKDTHE